jgi:hypothetical protein
LRDTDLLRQRMLAAAEHGLRVIAEDLLGRAQREAPVETGTLRQSAEVDLQAVPGGVEAQVSFNTVYAARQHEELTWKHPRGGKAKYLEDPLKQMVPMYEGLLGEHIRRAVNA